MNNLHLTETLTGLTYRLKQCEYFLNALKFSCWHQTFHCFLRERKCRLHEDGFVSQETDLVSSEQICIFVDDLVSSGRIHISVDEYVSLWTILSLVDGFISLWMDLYLWSVDKSVILCKVLCLCGLTCIH